MSLPTFDIDSTQVASIRSTDYEKLRPYDLYGRKRVSVGVISAEDAAEDDVIGMAKIPRNCRVLPGHIAFSALGASVTADIGVVAQDGSGYIDEAGTVADDPDFFTATPIDVSAAGSSSFCNLITENIGYVFEKDVIVTITLAGANPDEGSITLIAEYVND